MFGSVYSNVVMNKSNYFYQMKGMMFRYTFWALALLILAGCRSERRPGAGGQGEEVPAVVIMRYDLDLFRIPPDSLPEAFPELQIKYPAFLGTGSMDTASLHQLRNYLSSPGNRDLYEAVRIRYSNVEDLEKELTLAFRQLRHYFPSWRTPSVAAYISGGDYEAPVQLGDSILLIGLDNYLGSDWEGYRTDRLPQYLLLRMERTQILPDCIRLISKVMFPVQIPGNNLLQFMVEAGKRLWFTETMIPGYPGRHLIGYTTEQHRWITDHEQHVWAAIIGNNMLYATDGSTIRTFMADGPFTAEFSRESPPRLGEWIGWQIVRNYMEKNPEITPQELMEQSDAQSILAGSGYKPGR